MLLRDNNMYISTFLSRGFGLGAEGTYFVSLEARISCLKRKGPIRRKSNRKSENVPERTNVFKRPLHPRPWSLTLFCYAKTLLPRQAQAFFKELIVRRDVLQKCWVFIKYIFVVANFYGGGSNVHEVWNSKHPLIIRTRDASRHAMTKRKSPSVQC